MIQEEALRWRRYGFHAPCEQLSLALASSSGSIYHVSLVKLADITPVILCSKASASRVL